MHLSTVFGGAQRKVRAFRGRDLSVEAGGEIRENEHGCYSVRSGLAGASFAGVYWSAMKKISLLSFRVLFGRSCSTFLNRAFRSARSFSNSSLWKNLQTKVPPGFRKRSAVAR